MIGKRGLSPVVATVLLLLLTVTAVVIVATVIIPFTNKLPDATECISYRDYYNFEESFEFVDDTYRYNCYRDSDSSGGSDKFGFSVKGGSADGTEDIGGFDLVFIVKQGSSKTISVRDGGTFSDTVMLSSSGGVTIGVADLEVPGPGEVRTYLYQKEGEEYRKAEVYPVLKSGKICDKSDEIVLIECIDNVAQEFDNV
jgi:flagellin-like protein